MRIYEFSKKYGISNKELLDELKNAGFDVKNHMSMLDKAAIDFLNKFIAVVPDEPVVEKPQEKVIIKKRKSDLTKPKIKPPMRPVAIQVEEKKADPILIVQDQSVAQVVQDSYIPLNEIILTLLKWGILANKNMILTKDIVERIAHQYQIALMAPTLKSKSESKKFLVTPGIDLQKRLPIAVVLGHVDHGKTTLLDFIRNTRVAAKEKGGITQHLGAYEASTDHGNIVFLDTPGHEAFSKIRARGVKVADVAILVVAADDSVMPQTVEAMEHAKSMNVPIIVAINKIDKVDASRIEVVKRDLAQHGLLSEEWGGEVVIIPISAKTGKGIDRLLEMILLQTELMELKADISGPAKGYVLESKLEKGRGPVATLLPVHGNVHIGDYFVAGNVSGRVTSFVNSFGARLQSAGPSVPVQVAGFSSLPDPGDYFEVVSKEVYKNIQRDNNAVPRRVFTKESIAKDMIALIIKTDTNSSLEALIESIQKVSKKSKIGFTIVNSGIGEVNESDVVLAANTGAKIVALHIKAEHNAVLLAQKLKISIASFDVIYKLLESLEELAKGAVAPEMIRKKVGEAIVRRVFDIKNIGVIAGCYINDGFFSQKGTVVAWRGRHKIGEGQITSLQREKRTVKQVNAGFECGFIVDGITEWQIDDRAECYIEVPKS